MTTPEEIAREWTNVNQVMELVKQEGDANCERAFDFLLAALAASEQRVRSYEIALRKAHQWAGCLDEIGTNPSSCFIVCRPRAPGERPVSTPDWRRGVRVTDSGMQEVTEGLISKSDYEWLLFRLASLQRENDELRKRLRSPQ